MKIKYWIFLPIAAACILYPYALAKVVERGYLSFIDDNNERILGTLGNLFGGLTALFSGLAFAILILTIIHQYNDSRAQAERNIASIDMQAFFNMLADVKASIKKSCGEVSADDFCESLREIVKTHVEKKFGNDLNLPEDKKRIATIAKAYQAWQKPFYIFSFVCFHLPDIEKENATVHKIDYSSYLKSSLSHEEMLTLQALTYLMGANNGRLYMEEDNPFYDFLEINKPDNSFIEDISQTMNEVLENSRFCRNSNIPVDKEKLLQDFIEHFSIGKLGTLIS